MDKDKSPINIMVDKNDKDQATKIFNDLGLSMSSAINIYLRQIIKHEGIPFQIRNKKENDEKKD